MGGGAGREGGSGATSQALLRWTPCVGCQPLAQYHQPQQQQPPARTTSSSRQQLPPASRAAAPSPPPHLICPGCSSGAAGSHTSSPVDSTAT